MLHLQESIMYDMHVRKSTRRNVSLNPHFHSAHSQRTFGVLSSIRSFFFSPFPPAPCACWSSARLFFSSPSFFFASSTAAFSAPCFRSSFTSALCAATSSASASTVCCPCPAPAAVASLAIVRVFSAAYVVCRAVFC